MDRFACMPGMVLIKGAGDLATGAAHRLFQCGLRVVMTEIDRPTVVRRTVAFAEAVYTQTHAVEGVVARLADDIGEAVRIMAGGQVAVLIDPDGHQALALSPAVVVDGIMAKRNTGTCLADAALVIGLGPGFTAGQDVHAVIETQRGYHLGRVLWSGSAQANTGIPAPVRGFAKERLLRSPAEGLFTGWAKIGDQVKAGDTLGEVCGVAVKAQIDGVLRGLIRSGLEVTCGFKLGDIDPTGVVDNCYTISDKARAVGGGVLEALLGNRRLPSNTLPRPKPCAVHLMSRRVWAAGR